MLLRVIVLSAVMSGVYCQSFILPTMSDAEMLDNLKDLIFHCQKKFLCGLNSTTFPEMVECVDINKRCDNETDCANGLDEANCPTTCNGTVTCPDGKTCAVTCDGVAQCPGHEDEEGCAKRCNAGLVLCSDRQSCAKICDGHEQCPDGKDEENCAIECPSDTIQCRSMKKCATKCDGKPECPNLEDELTCPDECTCGPGSYLCNDGLCISRFEICNESNDCTESDDESPCS